MNKVEPIRSIQLISDMKNYLKRENERNYILFLTGIFTGLRISDILKLKIKDVKDRQIINVKEQKTNKTNRIVINKELEKAYKNYCKDKFDDDYLIKSRIKVNKAISREQAYKILKQLGEDFGLCSLGTHTMRKTFGFHYYKQYKDIALLTKMFNHSHPSITMDYIGITQNKIDDIRRNFKY